MTARRALPDGAWESTRLGYTLWSNDSHNTIALGVTPSDGRLHVAFPTHDGPVRYTRTVPGVLDHPELVTWSSRLFDPVSSQFPGAPLTNPTWCEGPLAVGNHDLGYAVSGDGGLTWRNNAGAPVATTTTGDTAGTITPFSPGIVVAPAEAHARDGAAALPRRRLHCPAAREGPRPARARPARPRAAGHGDRRAGPSARPHPDHAPLRRRPAPWGPAASSPTEASSTACG